MGEVTKATGSAFGSPLSAMCLFGNLEKVQHFLTTWNEDKILRSLRLKDRSEGANTPLHNVCLGVHDKCLELLLKIDGIEVNCFNDNLDTPLLLACKALQNRNDFSRAENCLRMLLNREDVNVHEPSEEGMSPLHYAVKYRSLQTAKLLVNRGAHVNATTLKPGVETPLHMIEHWPMHSEQNSPEEKLTVDLLLLLLKNRADLSAQRYGDERTTLMVIITQGYLKHIKDFLSYRLDPAQKEIKSELTKIPELRIVSDAFEEKEIISALNIDDASMLTPLMLAIINGYMEDMEFLLSLHKKDGPSSIDQVTYLTNYRDVSVLHAACAPDVPVDTIGRLMNAVTKWGKHHELIRYVHDSRLPSPFHMALELGNFAALPVLARWLEPARFLMHLEHSPRMFCSSWRPWVMLTYAEPNDTNPLKFLFEFAVTSTSTLISNRYDKIDTLGYALLQCEIFKSIHFQPEIHFIDCFHPQDKVVPPMLVLCVGKFSVEPGIMEPESRERRFLSTLVESGCRLFKDDLPAILESHCMAKAKDVRNLVSLLIALLQEGVISPYWLLEPKLFKTIERERMKSCIYKDETPTVITVLKHLHVVRTTMYELIELCFIVVLGVMGYVGDVAALYWKIRKSLSFTLPTTPDEFKFYCHPLTKSVPKLEMISRAVILRQFDLAPCDQLPMLRLGHILNDYMLFRHVKREACMKNILKYLVSGSYGEPRVVEESGDRSSPRPVPDLQAIDLSVDLSPETMEDILIMTMDDDNQRSG